MTSRTMIRTICDECKQFLTMQIGDNGKYVSVKCNCRIVIGYPSGIVSNIEKRDYKPKC